MRPSTSPLEIYSLEGYSQNHSAIPRNKNQAVNSKYPKCEIESTGRDGCLTSFFRNQNAIGGSVTRDTFQDAISLLEEIDVHDDSWHDWPLTATDGDCATLIELVSEDKVHNYFLLSICTLIPSFFRLIST